MISECPPGFTRIQDFVPTTLVEKQDKVFFRLFPQGKNMNGRKEQPEVTNMASIDRNRSEKSSFKDAEKEEERNGDNVAVVRRLDSVHPEATNYLKKSSDDDSQIQFQPPSFVVDKVHSSKKDAEAQDSEVKGLGPPKRSETEDNHFEEEQEMFDMENLCNISIAITSKENKEEGLKSAKRNILAMEVPRKQRSKRSTTVVRLPDFTFQNLPKLLFDDKKTIEETKNEIEISDKAEESLEYSKFISIARKPKSQILPKRVALPNVENQQLDDIDRLLYTGSPRQEKMNSTLHVMNDRYRAEQSSSSQSLRSERIRRKRQPRKSSTVNQRRKLHRSTTSTKAMYRTKSLKQVVENCLKQHNTNSQAKISSKSRSRQQPLKSPPQVTEPLVPQRSSQRLILKQKQKQQNMDKDHDDDDDCVEPKEKQQQKQSFSIDENVWFCPTVANLLNNKLVNVGDCVELRSDDADVIFGWFTKRGILCSNCAMVHSCATFGACGNKSGSLDFVCLKDGMTLKQLLDKNGTDDLH